MEWPGQAGQKMNKKVKLWDWNMKLTTSKHPNYQWPGSCTSFGRSEGANITTPTGSGSANCSCTIAMLSCTIAIVQLKMVQLKGRTEYIEPKCLNKGLTLDGKELWTLSELTDVKNTQNPYIRNLHNDIALKFTILGTLQQTDGNFCWLNKKQAWKHLKTCILGSPPDRLWLTHWKVEMLEAKSFPQTKPGAGFTFCFPTGRQAASKQGGPPPTESGGRLGVARGSHCHRQHRSLDNPSSKTHELPKNISHTS